MENQEKVAPGLTVEELKALYFAEDAIIEQPKPVYRLDSAGHRYYYTYDEDDNPVFYVSVTTLIKQTTPTSFFLKKWMVDNFTTYEEMSNYVQDRADYGTFMHSQIQELVINGRYDTDSIYEKIKTFAEANKLAQSFVNYADEVKRDILAFAQWMVDHNVKPLAVEIILTHPRGFAGAIDLVCYLQYEETGEWGEVYKTGKNAGKPKRTKKTFEALAIVDFKSGRKGFFEDHEIQLGLYRDMWNFNYPEHPVDKIFNWSPKAWRTNPGYNFTDQSRSKSIAKIPHLLDLAEIEDNKKDKNLALIEGEIVLKDGISTNLRHVTLSELIKARKSKKSEK